MKEAEQRTRGLNPWTLQNIQTLRIKMKQKGKLSTKERNKWPPRQLRWSKYGKDSGLAGRPVALAATYCWQKYRIDVTPGPGD
jgi:hypothetical protein